MRPIVKYPIDSLCPITNTIINRSYTNYRDAKPFLIANLESYCTYCERWIPEDSIHVEHIKPKAKYPNLETQWVNFVLSCSRCNGSDNKGTKVIKLKSSYFPTVNNTFKSFIYHDDGRVTINNDLNNDEKEKASKLMRLINLDFIMGHPEHKPKDKRDQSRRKLFVLAKKYLNKWESEEIEDLNIIIDLAKAYGHWSIWMQVFSNHEDVQNELISQFRGTFQNCVNSDINRIF